MIFLKSSDFLIISILLVKNSLRCLIFLQLIGGDLDGVKKERQAIRSKIIKIDDELKTIDTAIQSLQEELGGVTQKREQTFESIQKLRKQRDEGVCFLAFGCELFFC